MNETKTDFIQARRTVNVLDSAREIAGYAEDFWDTIEYTAKSRPFSSLLSVKGASSHNAKVLLQPSLEHMEAQHVLLPFDETEGDKKGTLLLESPIGDL